MMVPAGDKAKPVFEGESSRHRAGLNEGFGVGLDYLDAKSSAVALRETAHGFEHLAKYVQRPDVLSREFEDEEAA